MSFHHRDISLPILRDRLLVLKHEVCLTVNVSSIIINCVLWHRLHTLVTETITKRRNHNFRVTFESTMPPLICIYIFENEQMWNKWNILLQNLALRPTFCQVVNAKSLHIFIAVQFRIICRYCFVYNFDFLCLKILLRFVRNSTYAGAWTRTTVMIHLIIIGVLLPHTTVSVMTRKVPFSLNNCGHTNVFYRFVVCTIIKQPKCTPTGKSVESKM